MAARGGEATHQFNRDCKTQLMNMVVERMTHEAVCVQQQGAYATDFTPPESWSDLAPEVLEAKVVAHNFKEGLAQDKLVVWNTELPVVELARNEERLVSMCIAIQRIAKQAAELHRFWEDQRDGSKTWQCGREDEPPFCFPPLLLPTRHEFVEHKISVAITKALNNPDECLTQHEAFSFCEGAAVEDEHQSESESVDEGSSIGDRSGSEDDEDADNNSDDNSDWPSDDEDENEDENEGEGEESLAPPPKKQK